MVGHSREITWDAEDRLGADVYCVSCGYNLRGLRRAADCSECGVPIRYSLAGDRLAYSDPDWLRQVGSGTGCLALSLPWLWFPPAWAVFSYGLWCISAPDPGRSRRGTNVQSTVLRVLLTATPCMVWFGFVPLCVTYWFANAASFSFDPALAAVFLFGCLLLLVPPVAAVVMWRFVGHTRSSRIKRSSRLAFWAGSLSVLFVAGWAVDELILMKYDILVALGLLAVPMGVSAYVECGACLYTTWRDLGSAEAQSRALRGGLRYWQRQEPGHAATSGGRDAEEASGGARP